MIIHICPAPPGWRALWTNDDGAPYLQHVAAWALIQDDDEGFRYVSALVDMGGYLDTPNAYTGESYIGLVEPGESDENIARRVEECREALARMEEKK